MRGYFDNSDLPELVVHNRYATPKGRQSREKSLGKIVGLPSGLLALMALAEGPAYSAELTRRIVGNTMGGYVERGASLSNELARLEAKGLVKRGAGRWRRQIEITQQGERTLKLAVKDLQLALEVAKRRELC